MTASMRVTTFRRIAGLALAVMLVLAAGCGGGRKAVCEDPSYGGREDGRELAVPSGLDAPRATGRYTIPPIAAEAAGEVDPRCTAFPPRIAGVEDPKEARRNEARRRRQEQEAAAALAVAGASTSSPRELPPPPSTEGESVGTQTALYAEVYDLVATWAQSWDERRLDDYLASYATDFRPPQPLSRSEWEAARERRMLEGAQPTVLLDSLEVYQGAEGPVARFRQDFVFAGIEQEITKELLLVREGGGWRILSEQVIDVR
jgi:hypothetical protein